MVSKSGTALAMPGVSSGGRAGASPDRGPLYPESAGCWFQGDLG